MILLVAIVVLMLVKDPLLSLLFGCHFTFAFQKEIGPPPATHTHMDRHTYTHTHTHTRSLSLSLSLCLALSLLFP